MGFSYTHVSSIYWEDHNEVEHEIHFRVMEAAESNYGADADGNRGVFRSWYEEPVYMYPDTATEDIDKKEIDDAIAIAVSELDSKLDRYRRYY